ncbi:MAG: LysR substrate-binding domain-containing protein [Acidimicrobiia bacterium]
MDLRQLEYLVAVADEGSVTAAAAACFVAQPSLSQSIKALEHELGVALLHRVGRGVVLTSAGELAVAAARDALRAAAAVSTAVAAVRDVVAGRLDVVALATLSVDPLAGLVGTFRHHYPEVDVRIRQPETTDDLNQAVRDGSSEVGVTDLTAVSPGLVAHELAAHEFVAVVPSAVAATIGTQRLTVAHLARLPLVSAPRGTSSRRVVDEAFAAAGLEPRIAVETDQREALVALAAAGAGIAIVPEGQVAASKPNGVVVMSLRPRLARRVGIVHRAAPLSPAANAFLRTAGLSPAHPPATAAMARSRTIR